jgi:hypothetical protein
MFLGLKWDKHLRIKKVRYLGPSAFIFKTIPSEIEKLTRKPEDDLLHSSPLCLIAPRDHDFIELHIYLPNYFRLMEMAITVRHGVSDVTSPAKMDVFCGTHLDDCVMAFQELVIPRCDDNTKLLYVLPPQISGIRQNTTLYDFEDMTISMHMRVIRMVLYGIPPGICMTLGQVQIFGMGGKKIQLDDVQVGVQRVTEVIAKIEESSGTEQNEDVIQVPVRTPTIDNNYFSNSVYDDIFSKVGILMEAQAKEKKEDGREHYIRMLQQKTKDNLNLTFSDVLQLDLVRLTLSMTAHQRDTILIEHGYKVALFDPNQFLFYRDPKIETWIRTKLRTWNCHLCKTSIKIRNFSCRYCRHSFCKSCIHVEKMDIIEFMWLNDPQYICIECAPSISEQRDMIREIQVLSVQNQKQRQEHVSNIFDTCAVGCNERKYTTDEILISQFPQAGILSSVETDDDAAPIESILLDDTHDDQQLFWKAPVGVDSAHIIIVLPNYCKLQKMTLLVDKLGYSEEDKPEIIVSAGERLPQFTSLGSWKLPQTIEANDSLDWDVSDMNIHCRLVQFELRLGNKTKYLHLGRIRLYGKIISVPPALPLSDKQVIRYEEILKTKPRTTRVQLKTETKFYRLNNMLDLIVSSNVRYVSGFRICVSHSEEGFISQVKDIRVSFLSENEKKEIVSQQNIGTFIVPKVAQNTWLEYEFERSFENVKVVRLEFMSNYGAEMIELPQGKVFLFFNQII